MARVSPLQAITIALTAAAEVNDVQSLHGKVRFDEIKRDSVALLGTIQQTFFPGDGIAQQVFSGALAGIEAVEYVEPPANMAQTINPAPKAQAPDPRPEPKL